MSGVIKPVRRATKRPLRLMGLLLGLRQPSEYQPGTGGSIEVWQWTRPKYRLRAFILLLINALLFAGLGAFALWLRTGRYFAASGDAYWNAWWEAFDPTREQQLTLLDYLTYPIPVSQVPLMMVIIGLVMASLTAIPILVSMLYRLPYAIIFTAIICFVAMLPWLAATVTFCCILARWRPLQFSFHYATALIALLPVISYYALATRNASVSQVLPPVELAKLYVPWVLAVVAACVLMAVVLLIARLVNYRPGAIAPSMAVMFVAPVLLFESRVGRDELYYRLLEADVGPGSTTYFANNVDMSGAIRNLARERMARAADAAVSTEAMEQQVALEMQLRLVSEAFAQQQDEAASACAEFRRKFPKSRYIANALYLEGRARDIRIDQEAFRQRAILRHYGDFPGVAAEGIWRELHDRFPGSPLWTYATLRLAQLEARNGRIDSAIGLLDALEQFKEGQAAQADPPSGRWQTFVAFFEKRPASGTLGVEPAAIIQEGHKLRWLLAGNRDPQQADAALRRLMSFDPRHALYRQNLQRLRAEIPIRYPLTPLGDNLDVLIAATEPSQSRRIEQLRACVDRLRVEQRGDALAHARFELGLAYKQDNRSQEARSVFEDVLRLNADSPWALEANRQLAGMGIAGRMPASGPTNVTQPG